MGCKLDIDDLLVRLHRNVYDKNIREHYQRLYYLLTTEYFNNKYLTGFGGNENLTLNNVCERMKSDFRVVLISYKLYDFK